MMQNIHVKSNPGLPRKNQHLRKDGIFISKLDLNLSKILTKCYILSIALCDAETWALREVDQRYLESFEMWCWRRM
jgi:hypothetical protein